MHDTGLSILHALRHPLHAWRDFTGAAADRADAQARAAGLTVEVLPRGVRRYRDPRLDQLAAHRARQIARHCPCCRHSQNAAAPGAAEITATSLSRPIAAEAWWAR